MILARNTIDFPMLRLDEIWPKISSILVVNFVLAAWPDISPSLGLVSEVRVLIKPWKGFFVIINWENRAVWGENSPHGNEFVIGGTSVGPYTAFPVSRTR